MKILVADDSSVFRIMLRVLLTGWGYDVVEATDGEEACRLLKLDNGPELAIIDWEMPGLTGLEVCRILRQTGRLVYIVIFTTKSEPEYRTQARLAGADEYLTKPLQSRELLRTRVQKGVEAVETARGRESQSREAIL
jgi:CheY-like chemotaxis protein